MNAFDNSAFDTYKAEAREKWGNTAAYEEHAEKTKDYSKDKWDTLAAGMDALMADFALCMGRGDTPDSPAAQTLVKTLQDYITENYYHCTKEILFGLERSIDT